MGRHSSSRRSSVPRRGEIGHAKSSSTFECRLAPGAPPVVLWFTSHICPPCHAIRPTVEALAAKYPGVIFLEAPTERPAVRTVAAKFEISRVPSFVVHGGGSTTIIGGADPQKLTMAVIKIARGENPNPGAAAIARIKSPNSIPLGD